MHVQVLTNIMVQRHTPWGTPKLTLARWLHNVLVTCMLVEARTTALTLTLILALALALAVTVTLTLTLTLTLILTPTPTLPLTLTPAHTLTRRTLPRPGRASSVGSSQVCVTTISTIATAGLPTSSSSAPQHSPNALPGQCPSSELRPSPSLGRAWRLLGAEDPRAVRLRH